MQVKQQSTAGAVRLQCCVCKRVSPDRKRWLHPHAAGISHDHTVYSHGYCPECFMRAYAELTMTLLKTGGAVAEPVGA